MPQCFARANIDHLLELLRDPNLARDRRVEVIKLLTAEEDRLGRYQEQLEFAERRAAKGRDLLNQIRYLLQENELPHRARAERLVANFEATQKLLDGYCDQLREKVNQSRL
jgi:hypothetical protein